MEEEVSEPLQGLSFPAGPSLARDFGSFQENAEGRERERLLIWIGDDFSLLLLLLRGLCSRIAGIYCCAGVTVCRKCLV
jgi:hypothetical protein